MLNCYLCHRVLTGDPATCVEILRPIHGMESADVEQIERERLHDWVHPECLSAAVQLFAAMGSGRGAVVRYPFHNPAAPPIGAPVEKSRG